MTEREQGTALPASAGLAARRSMRHLVLDIRKAWVRAAEAQQRFNAARLKLALDLHEARARVEAGEEGDVTWWQWFAKNFSHSRSDAERLLAIASAANPQVAYDAAKARNAEANRAYRARQRGAASLSREMEPLVVAATARAPAVEILPPSPPPLSEERQIEEIAELFKRLSRGAQVRCALLLRKIMRGEA